MEIDGDRWIGRSLVVNQCCRGESRGIHGKPVRINSIFTDRDALAAVVNGDGLMEVDVNENPLRDELMPWADGMCDGAVTLSPNPGLGAAPDLDKMRAWRIIL